MHRLQIQKVSVLPTGGSAPGSELARQAIGANEQIRSATGVDLSKIGKRLGG
jgi:hypothetical protein